MSIDPLHQRPVRGYLELLDPLDARAAELDLSLDHLSPVIGSEVRGLDLRETLREPVVDFLYHLLVERNVIFFRGQDLTREQHAAFGRRFGKLEAHPLYASVEGHPDLLLVENDRERPPLGADVWHSDLVWREVPPLGSILLARRVPRVGGDTAFANMEAAYEGLDDDTKQRIQGLMAIHASHRSRQIFEAKGASQAEIARAHQHVAPMRHPVVRTHPDSGRKSLYVNRNFTLSLEGLPESESDELLNLLCGTALRPEYQCRFRWEVGSLAFWDNRSAQHYALGDYWPEARSMERVTIAGTRPL